VDAGRREITSLRIVGDLWYYSTINAAAAAEPQHITFSFHSGIYLADQVSQGGTVLDPSLSADASSKDWLWRNLTMHGFSSLGGAIAQSGLTPISHADRHPHLDITVKRKVEGWLGIGTVSSRPYMLKNGGNAWGTMVWGGTRVQLETDETGKPREWVFRGRYQQENNPDGSPVAAHDITFVKPVFMRRSDMGRPLAELIEECKVARATEAFRNNVFNDTPQGGIIWSPLWSPDDWAVNSNGGALYLAKEFLIWDS